MKLRIILLSLFVGIFYFTQGREMKVRWSTIITSKHYWNTKLVMESKNPFPAQKIGKELSESWARMICNIACANNKYCLGFNFYSKSNQYVCEYLPENFCRNRQRIALQAWPGGTVWDKLSLGMNQACIEQKFDNATNANYCDNGRYGCRATWPNCDTCVKTCNDCKQNYTPTTSLYNCTLWPGGHFERPIFGFCDKTATIVVKRNVVEWTEGNLLKYFMPLYDMYRISKLQSYKSMIFNFQALDGTNYSSTYINFAVDPKGCLMNMTYKSGTGDDGFRLGNKPLEASPFVNVRGQWGDNCGSFWLLNSTQSSASLSCPGGGVGMFGEIQYWSWEFTKSGIRWPKAMADKKVLIYADIKFDV